MLSLMDQFEQFCRTKPADEKYDYMKGTQCACAQFAASIGMAEQYYGTSDEKKIISPDDGYPFVEAEIYAATKPHTFGALADRLRDRVHDQEGGIFA